MSSHISLRCYAAVQGEDGVFGHLLAALLTFSRWVQKKAEVLWY